jgi:hypothetical protein
MSFDKFTNATTSIRCFEDVQWLDDEDGLGEETMAALKAKVLSSVEQAWRCDCTLVATSLLTPNLTEIKELWKFLNEVEDLKLVHHDVEANLTRLQHCSLKYVTCFFIFGGKLVSNQLSIWDTIEVVEDGLDISIARKVELEAKDRKSIDSAEGLDYGELVDVTGEGMTQTTDFHYTPKKPAKTIKPKKEAPVATRRSTRSRKN